MTGARWRWGLIIFIALNAIVYNPVGIALGMLLLAEHHERRSKL